jgi:hypothetical protein
MERKLGVVSGVLNPVKDPGLRASPGNRGSKRKLCQKVCPVKNRVPEIRA